MNYLFDDNNFIIYLFVTRGMVIFIFTMFYLFISGINKYNKEKFNQALIFSLATFEISAPLIIIYFIASFLKIISEIGLTILYSIFEKTKEEKK